MEVLDLENEYEQLKSEITELRTSLQKAKEAHTEAKQRAKALTLDFNREVSEELDCRNSAGSVKGAAQDGL